MSQPAGLKRTGILHVGCDFAYDWLHVCFLTANILQDCRVGSVPPLIDVHYWLLKHGREQEVFVLWPSRSFAKLLLNHPIWISRVFWYCSNLQTYILQWLFVIHGSAYIMHEWIYRQHKGIWRVNEDIKINDFVAAIRRHLGAWFPEHAAHEMERTAGEKHMSERNTWLRWEFEDRIYIKFSVLSTYLFIPLSNQPLLEHMSTLLASTPELIYLHFWNSEFSVPEKLLWVTHRYHDYNKMTVTEHQCFDSPWQQLEVQLLFLCGIRQRPLMRTYCEYAPLQQPLHLKNPWQKETGCLTQKYVLYSLTNRLLNRITVIQSVKLEMCVIHGLNEWMRKWNSVSGAERERRQRETQSLLKKTHSQVRFTDLVTIVTDSELNLPLFV